MGREIRRVPPNWKHPRKQDGSYQPLYDEDFDTKAKEWKTEFLAWEMGSHPDLQNKPERKEEMEFWEWHGDPPDRDYYRPKWLIDPTWCQVYETVSEGTPVTPPFATKEELIAYLVEFGDFWDQQRGNGGWPREHAESFIVRHLRRLGG